MTNWKPEKNHVTYVCYIPKEERERERGKDRNMGLVTVDYSANIFLFNKGKKGGTKILLAKESKDFAKDIDKTYLDFWHCECVVGNT